MQGQCALREARTAWHNVRPFAHDQVSIMSRTGILVACHGGALMNVMFLPQHAVVIELFPPLMKVCIGRSRHGGCVERAAHMMARPYDA